MPIANNYVVIFVLTVLSVYNDLSLALSPHLVIDLLWTANDLLFTIHKIKYHCRLGVALLYLGGEGRFRTFISACNAPSGRMAWVYTSLGEKEGPTPSLLTYKYLSTCTLTSWYGERWACGQGDFRGIKYFWVRARKFYQGAGSPHLPIWHHR